MRKLLLNVRKIFLLNYIVRKAIAVSGLFSANVHHKLASHWSLKGVIPIHFLGFNIKMKTDCDDGIVDRLYYQNTHPEQNELFVFSVLSKHSKTIIDIGAHTGIYSIVAAKSNPQAKVFSFEPHPYNYARLKSNVELNNLKNVQLVNKAVGDTLSNVEFNIPDDNRITDVASIDKAFSAKMYIGSFKWKVITAEQTTIDDFYNNSGLTNVDLIKMDVENYELPVFKGMLHTIQNSKPFILCELFHEPEKIKFIDELMKTNNYFVYDFTNEGLVFISNGVNQYPTGLNYLLSPVNLGKFVAYNQLQNLNITALYNS